MVSVKFLLDQFGSVTFFIFSIKMSTAAHIGTENLLSSRTLILDNSAKPQTMSNANIKILDFYNIFSWELWLRLGKIAVTVNRKVNADHRSLVVTGGAWWSLATDD